MAKSQSNGGTVDVDGAKYDWHLQREPRQSDDEGWKGLAISVVQRGAKREAWVEFPPAKRLLKGLPRGRLQLDDATISGAYARRLRLVGSRRRAASRCCSLSMPKAIDVTSWDESLDTFCRCHAAIGKLTAHQISHYSKPADYP